MALNFLAPTPDYVQTTAESRRFTKTLIGDFTFDQFLNLHRNKVFLHRNMTKVLAFHERNRSRGIETGTFRSSSSRTRGPVLGNDIAISKPRVDEIVVSRAIDRPKHQTNGYDASPNRQSASEQPDIEAMSQDCLKVKAQHGSIEDQTHEKRRSIRRQLNRQHEDHDAQLYMDIVNIRKKLNFKENAQTTDTRPRKRVRRENIQCHCHVTIWDNRLGLDQKEPIVRKSELCDISTTDLGDGGLFAEIKLQKPFVFKSSDLQVPLNTPQKTTVLGIGDKYFLEIKIIPTRADAEWPPIPVLGRSEGDQTAGLGRLAAEKLQSTLCARYMHLPQAPASDVPLSVFYLSEGSTYRTKYGLEVNATWSKGDGPDLMMKREEEEEPLNLWAVDEEGRTFGRRGSSDGKTSRSEPTPRSRAKQKPQIPTPVKVSFNIDTVMAKGPKEFKKATVTGLQCPVCPNQKFKVLEDLQFHFTTCHSKYKFVVEKQDFHPTSKDLSLVVFKISSAGTAKPRNSDREPRKQEQDLKWQAPAEPLDVHAYVNGNQNWVEQNWAEGTSKKPENNPQPVVAVTDPVSVIRSKQFGGFGPAQKGGFLPAEHVIAFRKPTRTKYPIIRLCTMTADKETMYTSISHRQIHVGEEARSESDDEIDDGWFVKKSLEALDSVAEKEKWNQEQRILRRRWNQARLDEKLSHPRYLSDCLVRFVRAEKDWLNGGSIERRTAFSEFLDELLQRRVINQEVVRDVWAILHDTEVKSDGTSLPNNESNASSKTTENVISKQQLTRQERAEIMLRLPPYACAVCTEPIEELRRHGLRCSEHDCEAPGVWYHNQCARCKRKDRFGWKCRLCVERLAELSKGKETEVLMV